MVARVSVDCPSAGAVPSFQWVHTLNGLNLSVVLPPLWQYASVSLHGPGFPPPLAHLHDLVLMMASLHTSSSLGSDKIVSHIFSSVSIIQPKI